ncbi:hypothetical protein BGX33_004745 [Mortierella sp. NVP41]|nr:hypothetical protein BGX33_004745 [Mortierella sp. NVP41]
MVASLEDHDHHHNKQLALRQRIQYYRLFWFKRDLKGVFLTVLSTFALYLLATQFHFFIAHDSSSTSITATTATSISSTPLDSPPLGDNRQQQNGGLMDDSTAGELELSEIAKYAIRWTAANRCKEGRMKGILTAVQERVDRLRAHKNCSRSK